ncbi:DUF4034 domain-containing protein [Dactylosporangium fulvum]|uniref:DUF4034 domain-containing protein n=1 Tax=Dactylosporangium fulvum TaxID=53359 RepID=A0ABY5WAC7_9ACTN|nr:DUF4034 domain-containing protein [Dactylosporangium fulvum]UWP85648.1 DUF4034 domain-containing protein [Dactylosporangium fulvum]
MVEAAQGDERTVLIDEYSFMPNAYALASEWVAAEPQDSLRALVQGAAGVQWAWDARGSRFARFTRRSQFQEFHRRLVLVERTLWEVVAVDEADPAPWTFLVTSARGLQVSRVEAQRRFAGAVRHAPFNNVAHAQMLQYLCGKWFGSHDEMFAFARSAAETAPTGSLLPALIAIAHLERWMALTAEEDWSYMRHPEVRAELRVAAERSIWHAEHRHTVGWLRACNSFALAFSLARDWPSAARVFDGLGNRVTDNWHYVVGPARLRFRMARRKAYANRDRQTSAWGPTQGTVRPPIAEESLRQQRSYNALHGRS